MRRIFCISVILVLFNVFQAGPGFQPVKRERWRFTHVRGKLLSLGVIGGISRNVSRRQHKRFRIGEAANNIGSDVSNVIVVAVTG